MQLHVLQEFCEIFAEDDEQSQVFTISQQGTNQLFLTLSLVVVSGEPSSRTICIQGYIQDQVVRILVDSGSSHTFISSVIAGGLSGGSSVCTVVCSGS